MNKCFNIDRVKIGENQRTFILAEMSANHNHDYNRAVELIKKQNGQELMQLSFKYILHIP